MWWYRAGQSEDSEMGSERSTFLPGRAALRSAIRAGSPWLPSFPSTHTCVTKEVTCWAAGVLGIKSSLRQLHVVVHTYNFSIQEAEAGELLQVRGQPGLYTKFKASLTYTARPCLKS